MRHRVLLVPTAAPQISATRALRELAALDEVGRHVLADDAEDATMLLFPDAHLQADPFRLSAIRRHPLATRYPGKAVVYDESDHPWRHLPGAYVSASSADARSGYQVPWAYYSVPDRAVDALPDEAWLFSFVGSPTAPVRERIYALEHPRGHVERVRGFTFFDPGSRDFHRRRARFAEVLARSSFVLCPRGRGLSSIRLYETMAAGRAPVILSDGWLPPLGPRWQDFALFLPEAAVGDLPDLLADAVGDAASMGAAAREAYEAWFSPQRCFHNLISALGPVLGAMRDDARPWEAPRRTAARAHLLGTARGRAGALRARLQPSRREGRP